MKKRTRRNYYPDWFLYDKLCKFECKGCAKYFHNRSEQRDWYNPLSGRGVRIWQRKLALRLHRRTDMNWPCLSERNGTGKSFGGGNLLRSQRLLYNAVNPGSNLKTTMRFNHSMLVHYVEPSMGCGHRRKL